MPLKRMRGCGEAVCRELLAVVQIICEDIDRRVRGIQVFRYELRQKHHVGKQHAGFGLMKVRLVGVDEKQVALCDLVFGIVDIVNGTSADNIYQLEKIVFVNGAFPDKCIAVGGEFHSVLKKILVFVGDFALHRGSFVMSLHTYILPYRRK